MMMIIVYMYHNTQTVTPYHMVSKWKSAFENTVNSRYLDLAYLE